MTERTLQDFDVGRVVRYVPYHADGDRTHPDCEWGTVTSISDKYVFVRFRGQTSEACKPDQLQP